MVRSGDFPVEFDEGGGLTNRRLADGKNRDPPSADFTYT
jgi:hypothetical protein